MAEHSVPSKAEVESYLRDRELWGRWGADDAYLNSRRVLMFYLVVFVLSLNFYLNPSLLSSIPAVVVFVRRFAPPSTAHAVLAKPDGVRSAGAVPQVRVPIPAVLPLYDPIQSQTVYQSRSEIGLQIWQ